jgi:hypothetical protein
MNRKVSKPYTPRTPLFNKYLKINIPDFRHVGGIYWHIMLIRGIYIEEVLNNRMKKFSHEKLSNKYTRHKEQGFSFGHPVFPYLLNLKLFAL